jgi:hypothetical protein
MDGSVATLVPVASGDMTTAPPSGGLQVLARHVAAVNSTVNGWGVHKLTSDLAPDCTMLFEGIPVGPFEGREAIAEAYRTNPPDDTIEVLEATFKPARVEATYAWSQKPDQAAGRILLDLEGELITKWIVEYWTD